MTPSVPPCHSPHRTASNSPSIFGMKNGRRGSRWGSCLPRRRRAATPLQISPWSLHVEKLLFGAAAGRQSSFNVLSSDIEILLRGSCACSTQAFHHTSTCSHAPRTSIPRRPTGLVSRGFHNTSHHMQHACPMVTLSFASAYAGRRQIDSCQADSCVRRLRRLVR